MWARLERQWRGIGTALFLAIIGLGGSALALSVFPLIALASPERKRRRRRIQRVLHHSLRLYCRAIHALRIADIHLDGLDSLRSLQGTLIIANHPSLLDVVMIMAAVPEVQCVVKGALWKNPFFRLTVEGAGYIRNDLPAEDLLAACTATLRDGNNLIVFPEGGRTRFGQPLQLHRGFANIALRAPADILPLLIHCHPPVLHKGNPWWRVPPHRTTFRIEAGERLDMREFLGYGYHSLSARHLVTCIQQYYVEKIGHGRT